MKFLVSVLLTLLTIQQVSAGDMCMKDSHCGVGYSCDLAANGMGICVFDSTDDGGSCESSSDCGGLNSYCSATSRTCVDIGPKSEPCVEGEVKPDGSIVILCTDPYIP